LFASGGGTVPFGPINSDSVGRPRRRVGTGISPIPLGPPTHWYSRGGIELADPEVPGPRQEGEGGRDRCKTRRPVRGNICLSGRKRMAYMRVCRWRASAVPDTVCLCVYACGCMWTRGHVPLRVCASLIAGGWRPPGKRLKPTPLGRLKTLLQYEKNTHLVRSPLAGLAKLPDALPALPWRLVQAKSSHCLVHPLHSL
ncbi:unnamed protein product, partial [Protopolystoma xenopodis]